MLLAEARERTLRLVEPVSDPDLDRVHDPLMSPLVWDLGHIAAYEDVWVCHRTGGLDLLRPDLAELYDAFETPRAERGDIPYLRRAEALDYMAAVRERSLEVLAATGPDHHVWQLVAQHEHQHDETMLQTLQLADPGVFAPERARGRRARRPPARSPCPAGSSSWAFAGAGFVYDNERPRHLGGARPLRDRPRAGDQRGLPEFVEDDGYQREELWSERGLGAPLRERWERPLYWTPDERSRAVRPRGRARARPARDARVVVRGRRLRALARRTPAERDRVGARRAGGRRGARRTSTSSTSAPAPPGRSWATAGSGPPASSAATRASRRSRTASTRRCSSTAATACSAAPPGPRARRWRARPSATGTCRSGARSSPASAARRTRR